MSPDKSQALFDQRVKKLLGPESYENYRRWVQDQKRPLKPMPERRRWVIYKDGDSVLVEGPDTDWNVEVVEVKR